MTMFELILRCALACAPAALLMYVIGVRVGKRYERRVITNEFQELLNRLLHYAAKEDYHSLHLMLIDLCADEELVNQVNQLQAEAAKQEPKVDLSQLKQTHLAPQDVVVPAGTTVGTEKKPTG